MNDAYPIPDFLRRPVEAPRERPILFSAPMVKALLAGVKTQTRRVMKPQPGEHIWTDSKTLLLMTDIKHKYGPSTAIVCPYGKPGDQLRVRETAWQRPERTQKMMREGADTWPPFIYDADYGPDGIPESEREDLKRWGWKRRPSIHLPRLGSRILLEITAIRVERLNDISEADARAEGVTLPTRTCTMYDGIWRDEYRLLWESINGPGSWAANPWVWCLTFKRV